MKIPAHTAMLVAEGTLDEPEKVYFFLGDYATRDGEPAIAPTNKGEFENAGFVHIATLKIDKTAKTSMITYVNPAKNTGKRNLHAHLSI
ncbi:MAG: hypothetical protein ACRC80_22725 [Waterburya sp.]